MKTSTAVHFLVRGLLAMVRKPWVLALLVWVVGIRIYDKFAPFHPVIPYSTQIKDRNGELIHAFLSPDDKWRMYAELGEITPLLKETFVFKEDKYFYMHRGVNPIALGRAAMGNVLKKRRVSGASTITMQVVRMLEPRPRTYRSKLIEAWNALRLERQYSKEEILQLYFNLVPFGGNIEGIKAASVLYYGKPPQLLSLAEIATLTVVPNNPRLLKSSSNQGRLLNERNKWLKKFREGGLFSDEIIGDALAEPIVASRREAPKGAPHLAIRLRKAYPSDHHIISSLEQAVQSQGELIVRNYVDRLRSMGIHNASVLVLENKTMEVAAYVGSADFKNAYDGGQVDGVRAVRSPGSTLKPLLYASVFDQGMAIPHTVLNDVPSNFNGYEPENFDRKFNGPVSVEYALSHSLNIPAVKLLQQLGVESMIASLKKAGFQAVERQAPDLGLSLVLGGCGTTLEELTRLYSVFARKGDLSPIRLRSEPGGEEHRSKLLSEESAYMVTRILMLADRPDFPNNFDNTYRLPRIAWKTGTSYGKRDAWSIGYNDRYTIGVWVGNFSGAGVPELSGANIATPLLFELFNSIDYNSSKMANAVPSNLEMRRVCAHSGDIPSQGCDHTVNGEAIIGVSAFRRCEHLRKVFTDARGAMSYCASCMPKGTSVVKREYPNLAPELVAFYQYSRIPYPKIPPHNPSCQKVVVDGAPVIVNPSESGEYYLQADASAQIQLLCHAGQEVEYVTWYINDRLLEKAPPNQPVFFVPPLGVVKISCADNKGRNTDRVIFTKRF
jgi:penicillin-binding protein 1C